MGLLDFLNDNEEPANDGGKPYKSSSKDKSKGFLDNLISLFTANPAVQKAYFGLLYEEGEQEDLFLAVEHEGKVEEIQTMTDILKQTFLPNREMYFTSTDVQPELLSYIEQANFPFYVKNKPQPLNVAVMKQWFDPVKYKLDLLFQIRTCKLISLFKDFDPQSNILNFQTFIRNGREFIPLFSDKDMIYKSGMTEVPSDLTVVEFDWAKVEDTVDGKLRQHFYVLNPGTSFEVEFNA